MKITQFLPIVLLGLSACTTPTQAPPPATAPTAAPAAAVPQAIQAKNVLCSDLKPAAMAAHAQCVAPSAVTDARCDEILPEVVQAYQACRAIAVGGITLGVAHASLPPDASVTSNSSQSDSPVVSSTTSIQGGERSVSITINGVTHTLSDSSGPTPFPDWNPPG